MPTAATTRIKGQSVCQRRPEEDQGRAIASLGHSASPPPSKRFHPLSTDPDPSLPQSGKPHREALSLHTECILVACRSSSHFTKHVPSSGPIVFRPTSSGPDISIRPLTPVHTTSGAPCHTCSPIHTHPDLSNMTQKGPVDDCHPYTHKVWDGGKGGGYHLPQPPVLGPLTTT
ncbi:hypothetical protein B0I35DRAFT_29034 [Stachybotrys elegans]|uniref:Uncharacterized protein n=1 Tax=Stachybotrys elegans TaxID=80388 RepID=A0A8K0T3T9_9HYPO|nr:hypothetical protein B0I35DRAFT_29034 [Stachybotrys elegans]